MKCKVLSVESRNYRINDKNYRKLEDPGFT